MVVQLVNEKDQAEMAQALRRIAPDGVRIDVRTISSKWIEQLAPQERDLTAGFVDGRRAEFATGRASLRRAMSDLVSGEFPIMVGERREPILPTGILGSITHTDSIAAAVASNSRDLLGLGVDVEIEERVTADLSEMVLSAPEKNSLKCNRELSPLADYFSAKEAAFKAIHGLINRYIDFTDLALTFETESFAVEPLFSSIALQNIAIEGRLIHHDSYVAAIAWARTA